MKLSEYEIRVVLRMHERGASVRGLPRDLGVTVPPAEPGIAPSSAPTPLRPEECPLFESHDRPAQFSFPHSRGRRGSAPRIRGVGGRQLPAFAEPAGVSFPHSRGR